MLVFNVNFEFSKDRAYEKIIYSIESNSPNYICVVDGNVLATAQKDILYREIINTSLLNICDGSSIALFTNWIYGTKFSAFTGPMIFKDLLYKDFKQLLLGNTSEILGLLKNKLKYDGCKIENYDFISLPFKSVEEFDYESIADNINRNSYDIIWVSLGAPKQEIFISKLTPLLKRGVVFAIGAAFNLILVEQRDTFVSAYMKKYHLGWCIRVAQEPKRIGGRAWNYLKLIPQLIYTEIVTKNKKN